MDELPLEIFQICVVHYLDDKKRGDKLQAEAGWEAIARITPPALLGIIDKPDPRAATSRPHADPADRGVSNE